MNEAIKISTQQKNKKTIKKDLSFGGEFIQNLNTES